MEKINRNLFLEKLHEALLIEFEGERDFSIISKQLNNFHDGDYEKKSLIAISRNGKDYPLIEIINSFSRIGENKVQKVVIKDERDDILINDLCIANYYKNTTAKFPVVKTFFDNVIMISKENPDKKMGSREFDKALSQTLVDTYQLPLPECFTNEPTEKIYTK